MRRFYMTTDRRRLAATHLLLGVSLGVLGLAAPAAAQEQPEAADQAEDSTAGDRSNGEIVVTGSRLRGVALAIDRSRADGPPFAGDEDLLVAAIGSLVVAAPALLSAQSVRAVSLNATTRSDGAIVFSADHEGAELPVFWRSILAEDDAREASVPGGSAASSALTLLRAARQVAELHGGRMSVDCRDGMTTLSIAIPTSR
jgi:hypothetical protein